MPKVKKFVLGPNQTKWIKALESGKYKQGHFKLNDGNNKFCCLGVACDLFKDGLDIQICDYGIGISYEDQIGVPPRKIWKNKLGLKDVIGKFSPKEVSYWPKKLETSFGVIVSSLTELNDSGEVSFKTIAKIIKSSPEVFFKEPK